MNKYLVEIYHDFKGYESFVVEALDKTDALIKAKADVEYNPNYSDGNYNTNDIRCVKKIKSRRNYET